VSTITPITSDEQILATFPVMSQLRPAVKAADYLPQVRRMMASQDYHLVAVWEGETVRAVAGYRFMEMLYYGQFMYVDDLVTDAAYRSHGYGQALMDWLKAEARSHGCEQLQLDSGVQREDAHRFYFREGLTINCYHFRVQLT
jgi:GNAT superfamily N-acetyltransferase